RPIDWLIPFSLQRFPQMEMQGGQMIATDGIASFAASNDFTLAPTAESASALERQAAELSPYVAAWDRITALNAKEPQALLRAKISVSEAKRAFDATRDAQTPAYRRPRAKQAEDNVDWFPLKDSGVAKAHAGLSRGKATHRFLAICDLVALARGEKKLAQELARLIEAGFLLEEDREQVNLQDIAWFLNSELGKRIVTTFGKNLREKPFTCRIDASELNAPAHQGFVILQGVLDIIFKEDRGWILIDYKTDFCGANGERIAELRESYTPQLQLYRVLVERTLKEPVAETWVAFLQGRKYFEIPANDVKGIAWTSVVESGAVVFPEASGKNLKVRGV
ncbi:MAG: PD-(D/E)XK nuclease family protein, partial [Candidatus Sumerlaeota bacterium]